MCYRLQILEHHYHLSQQLHQESSVQIPARYKCCCRDIVCHHYLLESRYIEYKLFQLEYFYRHLMHQMQHLPTSHLHRPVLFVEQMHPTELNISSLPLMYQGWKQLSCSKLIQLGVVECQWFSNVVLCSWDFVVM